MKSKLESFALGTGMLWLDCARPGREWKTVLGPIKGDLRCLLRWWARAGLGPEEDLNAVAIIELGTWCWGQVCAIPSNTPNPDSQTNAKGSISFLG